MNEKLYDVLNLIRIHTYVTTNIDNISGFLRLSFREVNDEYVLIELYAPGCILCPPDLISEGFVGSYTSITLCATGCVR